MSVEDIIATEFVVYPNPFTDLLQVSSQVKVDSLKVYNIAGQLVKQNKNVNSINVSELSKGIYFLEVTAESSRNVKKVIKN